MRLTPFSFSRSSAKWATVPDCPLGISVLRLLVVCSPTRVPTGKTTGRPRSQAADMAGFWRVPPGDGVGRFSAALHAGLRRASGVGRLHLAAVGDVLVERKEGLYVREVGERLGEVAEHL